MTSIATGKCAYLANSQKLAAQEHEIHVKQVATSGISLRARDARPHRDMGGVFGRSSGDAGLRVEGGRHRECQVGDRAALGPNALKRSLFLTKVYYRHRALARPERMTHL